MPAFQFNQVISGFNTVTTNTDRRFTSAVFFPYKGFTNDTPVQNSSAVWLGVESGKLPFNLSTGTTSVTVTGPDNLNNFWFKATSGDGFYVITK